MLSILLSDSYPALASGIGVESPAAEVASTVPDGDEYGDHPVGCSDVIEWVTRHGGDVGVFAARNGAFPVPEAADIGGH